MILVAGCARRLGDAAGGRPKCLVPVGPAGETLLELAARRLAAVGVRRLVLATGYRAEQVERAAERLPLPSRCIFCPDFETTQNAVSLWRCREALQGASFFKLDGDVLFPAEVLRRTLQVAALPGTDVAVAVDRGAELDEEAMKVVVEGGRIRAFGKDLQVPEGETDGLEVAETLGVECVSAEGGRHLFEILERFVQEGRTDVYYEAAYQRLADEGRCVRAADVTGLPWTEVDTPADLHRARRLARRVAAANGRRAEEKVPQDTVG